jgi:CubicO group peptidase (beta-lactamase class C family)
MTSQGFSKARLDRMHDVMAGYVERGVTSGLITLVCRRGDVHVDVIGKSALDGKPLQRDSIFRISSMTKPITAAATMILVEECKLRLDDPIDEFIPEMADRRVLKRIDGPVDDTEPAHRPITVRDLLTFRLGFGMIFAPPDTYPIQRLIAETFGNPGPPMPATHPAPDEWLAGMNRLPLMFQPGEKWLYSTGSEILGVLIARVSGQSFEAFLQERIFEPLGIKDTAFAVPLEKLDRLTTCHWTVGPNGELGVFDGVEDSQWLRQPAFEDGSAGLVSTVDDYFSIGQMLLNKGKLGNVRILSRPSVELMTTNQLTPEQSAASPQLGDLGYGFGGSVVTKRKSVAWSIGTYGWDGGMGSSWYIDPQEDLNMVLMDTAAWTSPVPPDRFKDFWTLTYQAIDD